MDPRERIYDLLISYWESTANGFVAAWCEGLSVEETARRLDADLDSAAPCSFKNYTRGLNESHGMGDGVILVKQVGTWVHVLQPYMIHAWHDDALQTLSRDGGRALNIGWHVNGAERLTYATDGRIVATMPLTMGKVPPMLEPYAYGLRFGCDEPTDPECENPEDPITDTESIASAFVIAGRITGQELGKELLDATHTRYLIREQLQQQA